MRFLVVLLTLSTLAAAGPLPSFSKAALEARNPTPTPANGTLGPRPIAALTQLKAVYDNLNTTPSPAKSIAKRDFWKWLKDAFEAPGLKARSSITISTPANGTLGSGSATALNSLSSDTIATLTELRAIYDSLNTPQHTRSLKVKRDFWQWLKDAFEAPGMKARSSTPEAVSEAVDMDGGLKAKRNI